MATILAVVTQIIAHRGDKAHYPENTLLAFQQAILAGADGIETDVHLSLDGALVIIHDEQVARTTNGQGFVGQQTLAQLRALDAGSWFAPEFKGQQIPTLQEVLTLLDTLHFTGLFNLEIKTDKVAYPGIEAKVVALLTATPHAYTIVLSSFNPTTLKKLHRLAPQFKLASLFEMPWWTTIQLLRHHWSAGWHPDIRWLPWYQFLLPKKLVLRPWTVATEKQLRYCLYHRVAGLFTDDPQLALKWRQEIQGR